MYKDLDRTLSLNATSHKFRRLISIIKRKKSSLFFFFSFMKNENNKIHFYETPVLLTAGYINDKSSGIPLLYPDPRSFVILKGWASIYEYRRRDGLATLIFCLIRASKTKLIDWHGNSYYFKKQEKLSKYFLITQPLPRDLHEYQGREYALSTRSVPKLINLCNIFLLSVHVRN